MWLNLMDSNVKHSTQYSRGGHSSLGSWINHSARVLFGDGMIGVCNCSTNLDSTWASIPQIHHYCLPVSCKSIDHFGYGLMGRSSSDRRTESLGTHQGFLREDRWGCDLKVTRNVLELAEIAPFLSRKFAEAEEALNELVTSSTSMGFFIVDA